MLWLSGDFFALLNDLTYYQRSEFWFCRLLSSADKSRQRV